LTSARDLQLLSAQIDGALDTPQQLALQVRLYDDARLQEQLQYLLGLQAAVRSQATHYRAPLPLRRFNPAPSFVTRWAAVARKVATWSGRFAWRPLALAFSVVAVLLWQTTGSLSSMGDAGLMQAAVSSHLRATSGPTRLDLASADPGAVQPWLSERLAFTAPLPRAEDNPAALLGARLDSLQGRAVAALVYRLNAHLIDLFVWPVAEADGAVVHASVQGFNVSHWTRDGLRYCVVSDLPRSEGVRLALALAQAQAPTVR
jgi:anti-sigma factor RsiW